MADSGNQRSLQDTTTLISVVDDDPSVCRALARLVRSMGFHVATFASAEEFLDANQLTKADCLVLDVHLSGISGLDLQRLLQARGVAPPIIFISADADLTDQQLIQSNAVAYLPKPVEDAALISAIQRAIAGRLS